MGPGRGPSRFHRRWFRQARPQLPKLHPKCLKREMRLIQFEKTGMLNWHSSKIKRFRIKSKSNPERALEFIKSETTSGRVIEYLMRHYPRFFNESIGVSAQTICSSLKISSKRFLAALKQLEQENLIQQSKILR